MASENGRSDFLELPHEPQDLDLVRRHLAWTPEERLRNLKRVNDFVKRARNARSHAVVRQPAHDR